MYSFWFYTAFFLVPLFYKQKKIPQNLRNLEKFGPRGMEWFAMSLPNSAHAFCDYILQEEYRLLTDK